MVKTLIISNLTVYPKHIIMLHNKDIKNIHELKTNFTHSWFEVDYLLKVTEIFKLSKLLKSFSELKKQGYSFTYIISVLLILPFIGLSNIHQATDRDIKAKKDVFYRLKNNPIIDWRSIIWIFSLKFVNLIKAKTTQNTGVKCLIIDDSFLEKTGKYIEKISRVWDHVSRRALLGFKLNVLGFWDGISFIPVDFSLHREKGKNKNKPFGLTKKDFKRQFQKKRNKETASYERIKEADQTKIKTGVKMFKRAVKQGLQFEYLLMDSWFTCNEFIEAVRNIKTQTVHLIGMYKISKTKFNFKGKLYTYSQIRNLLGKPKRNRKTGYYYLETEVLLDNKPLKLFFSRKGKRGNWKTFLTTNTNLSFIQMLKIYSIRWSIEVFFKESKQLLYLGKEQSNDFDSQIAAISLVMIQYILISTRFRFENYESKGALFKQSKAEVIRIRLSERIWGLLMEILKIVTEIFENEDEDDLMEKMFNNDKLFLKINNFIRTANLAA